MIAFPADVVDALSARSVQARDFLWIEPFDRETRAPVGFGYWSDVSRFSDAEVIDPQTGGVVLRTFEGAGQLISIDAVRSTSGMDINGLTIEVSHIGNIDAALRLYDIARARVEVFRGFFDGYRLIAPAVARFVGRVETLEIPTAAAGGVARARLDVSPLSYQLNFTNPATRSDAHLRERAPDDSGRKHAAVVPTWSMWWGTREKKS